MAAKSWLNDIPLPDGLPLIDLSQAAPADPPPAALRDHIAKIARDHDNAHLYGPVLGMPALREKIATEWSKAYDGAIAQGHIAITSGCNQAFCAAISAVAAPGDNVILPSPWYFNHKMHLDMAGLNTRALPVGPNMLPDPDKAAALIDDKTAAIVLVTPNNPTGAEYPPALIARFADLAQNAGIALILDETYRDYASSDIPPHDLFARADWPEFLIHLYSFSKAYRLTGHRVGALIAGQRALAEVEKYLDTVSICANQLAQHAALFGLSELSEFVQADRIEMLSRRDAAQTLLNTENARVLSVGAFFACVEHQLNTSSEDAAKMLLAMCGVLTLPMSMFAPKTDPMAQNTLRIALANVDTPTLTQAAKRISALNTA